MNDEKEMLAEESGALNSDKIEVVNIVEKMKESYLDYSMSVIAARAIPDVRDGLKPVQRRLLWAMQELGAFANTPHRKVARIVGDAMGKYHPHGDSSLEDALVNMAQDWKNEACLVDGHGNFGSIDGDSHAAARYIEARLSKISSEMLADINKDTVDFVPNFDDTEKEPSVLPARFPNLLVNGSTGIAVGMATNIPTHNLAETVDALQVMIQARKNGTAASLDDVLAVLPGPDFPTGGYIVNDGSIRSMYETGVGHVTLRGNAEVKPLGKTRERIVITEIPYGVNKADLVKAIADLVKEKRLEGVSELNDYSGRDGIEIDIDLKSGTDSSVVLNCLYRDTSLQRSLSVNMLCLVPVSGSLVPRVMPLTELLSEYLDHQMEVLSRKVRYERIRTANRIHILEGLLCAADDIDNVIHTIKSSSSVQEAREKLMAAYQIDEVQAEAITEMRLRSLAGLEITKLEDEKHMLFARLMEYDSILSDESVLLDKIAEDLQTVNEKYGQKRRSKFVAADKVSVNTLDLIPDEDVVVVRTASGYIKRMKADVFRSQAKGGRGVRALSSLPGDYVKNIISMKTHDRLLFFTTKGRMYPMYGYKVPEHSRTARGTNLVNLLSLQDGEKITAVVPSSDCVGRNIYMVSYKGKVKCVDLSGYLKTKSSGVNIWPMDEGDHVVSVHIVEDSANLLIVSAGGKCVRFPANEIRVMGRSAHGIRGISLKDGDYVIGMQPQTDDALDRLFILTGNGFARLVDMDSVRATSRGTKGVYCYRYNDKIGELAKMLVVRGSDEILVATTDDNLVRMKISGMPTFQKRAGVGAQIVKLSGGAMIADVEKVYSDGSEEDAAEE